MMYEIEKDVESIISIEFNPVRVGFHTDTSADIPGQKGLTSAGGFNLYAEDILNVGVKVQFYTCIHSMSIRL